MSVHCTLCTAYEYVYIPNPTNLKTYMSVHCTVYEYVYMPNPTNLKTCMSVHCTVYEYVYMPNPTNLKNMHVFTLYSKPVYTCLTQPI